VLVFIRAPFYVLLVFVAVFCLLFALAKLSLLAKRLARKTALRKPNRGEGIVSRKPRLKSAYCFLGLLYCFIVLLCVCVVSWPYMIYFPTAMARYTGSLFMLKVPLNTKQTNKQTNDQSVILSLLLHCCSPQAHLGSSIPVSSPLKTPGYLKGGLQNLSSALQRQQTNKQFSMHY